MEQYGYSRGLAVPPVQARRSVPPVWARLPLPLILAGILLLTGAVSMRTQQDLAEKIIRLHIIAESDAPEDQALKLAVRDAVLEQTARLLGDGAEPGDGMEPGDGVEIGNGAEPGDGVKPGDTAEPGGTAGARDRSERLLRSALPDLEAVAERVLRERGCGSAVRAELGESAFPTRVYDGFSLPAGRYLALRVVIGSGRGRNWWCVVFPPLCGGTVIENMKETEEDTRREGGTEADMREMVTKKDIRQETSAKENTRQKTEAKENTLQETETEGDTRQETGRKQPTQRKAGGSGASSALSVFSDGELRLITEEDGGYLLRFKTVELWEQVRRRLLWR